MSKMPKFNVKDTIPDTIKCKKCGIVNGIPDNLVFKIDPDGDSVFYDKNIPKEEKKDNLYSITAYCSGCVTPLYEIEGDINNLEEITEREAFKLEFEDMLKDGMLRKKKRR